MDLTYKAGLHKYIFHHDHIQKMREGKPVGPIHVTLFPTLKCQLHCAYCFCQNQNRADAELSWEDFEVALETLVKHGLLALEFAGGGEPTLWTHFERAVNAASARGLKLSLITNGITMNSLPVELLKKFQWIRISMVGIDRLKAINFSRIPTKVSLSYTIAHKDWLVDLEDFWQELNSFVKDKGLVTRVAVEQPATSQDVSRGRAFAERFGAPFFFSPKETGTPAGCYMAWVRAEVDWKGFFLPCPAVMFEKRAVGEEFRLCHVKDLDRWLQANPPRNLGFKCGFCDCGKEINDFIRGVLDGIKDIEFV
jgi:uncharacterized Fe-S cluster-containing radical SAM superfamily protein